MPFAGSSVTMNFVKLVMFYGVITYVSAIEPFSALGAIGTAVVAGLYTVFTPIKCQFKECCTSKWISLNTTGSHKLIVFCVIKQLYFYRSYIYQEIKIKLVTAYTHK